ncbi:MAG: restriction endonuclease subunit S [Sulfurimonas sp.]|nr:restriction endonuclease subunit S [Sulfurimonas sp.]
MRYSKYPSYRDSGVEWLGEIPNHWQTSRLKFLCNITTGGKDTENKVDDGIYPFYVRSQTVERINSYSFNGEAILTAGDGVGVGKVFHYVNDKFDFHQRVYMFYSFQKVAGRFLFEYIKNNFYKVALSGVAKSTVDSLRLPLIQNFMITVPPLQEQQTIANYLDKATAKIDTLIEKQTKLIARLKEKRQAVISTAVTRGLDNTVAMKDSGVDWLGEIPEAWCMSKLKYDSYIKARVGWHGLTSDELFEDGDAYAVTGSDFSGNTVNWSDCRKCTLERYKQDRFIQLQDDDLLVTKDGTIGKIIKVNKLPDIATLNGGIFVIRPLQSRYNTSYYYWLLISTVFKGFVSYYKTGSTISHLYQDTFCQMPYALPSMKEQQAIANYLHDKTSKIDTLITKSTKAIDLLKEKRTALISSAVTGKIDVREIA